MKKILMILTWMVIMPGYSGPISNSRVKESKIPGNNMKSANPSIAAFAGGCFWCMEPPFVKLEGVISVVAGYTGGSREDANYAAVSSGGTGHYEAIQLTYDADKISYETLLTVFWMSIDPTDKSGQFADKGSQYQTAIFYHDIEQKNIAERTKSDLKASGKFSRDIAVKILAASEFYPAEEYHRQYYLKNPAHYTAYSLGSGRKSFLDSIWNKEDLGIFCKYPVFSDSALKKKLTPKQY